MREGNIIKTCFGCGATFRTFFASRVRCCPCSSARSTLQVSAMGKVGHAIRTGKLVRQPCEVCGKAKADAHHDDYSQPLAVRWLCRRHHQLFHAAQYAAIRATATQAAAT